MNRDESTSNNSEVFFTKQPNEKPSDFKEAIIYFDNKVWEKGRSINFLGLGSLLPSKSWTTGESSSPTANFVGNIASEIGKVFSNAFASGNTQNDELFGLYDTQEAKGYVVDEGFESSEDSSNEGLNLNLTTMQYEKDIFDKAPEKFDPDFGINK